MWSALGKYRAVVVSIALFLLLDASVLTLNFYISYKIADDAVGVNISGRQRMLSQRTAKSLFELDIAQAGSEDEQRILKELELSHDLFNTTLKAFDTGQYTLGAANEEVLIKKVRSDKARSAIDEAKTIWKPLSKYIQDVLQSQNSSERRQLLTTALSYSSENNLKLLKLMNDLTVDLENVATSQAKTLRYVQTGGISLAVINFLFILFHFLGELRSNDRRLEAARQETTEILNTVNEGLFLLDSNLILGNQHSAHLSTMFGGKNVKGISFSDLIRDLVKSKDLETAERFVNLLFKPNIKDNLIKDLNPLTEVELNIPDRDGGFSTHYLCFDFTRVNDSETGKSSILVTVIDITRSVLLGLELADEKERSEQQMETLTSILHTDPQILKRFLQDAFDSFSKINNILKDQNRSNSSMTKKLHDIFIEVHNFKGDASALELDNFANLANKFEDDIEKTIELKNIDGNDFLKLTVHLDNLIKYSESVQEIANKLANFSTIGSSSNPADKRVDSKRWQHLHTLCSRVSSNQGKAVQLVLTGLNETQIDSDTESLINDVCIQFIRNAIVHSIESPELRQARNKPEQGRIDVRLCNMPNGELELSVYDDGAGIDYEKIRSKAIGSGNWTESKLSQWDNRQLLALIFEPGFSTANKRTNDAGRGVGMDLIRSRVIGAKGRMKIRSRSNSDCQFTIVLPNPSDELKPLKESA